MLAQGGIATPFRVSPGRAPEGQEAPQRLEMRNTRRGTSGEEGEANSSLDVQSATPFLITRGIGVRRDKDQGGMEFVYVHNNG